MIQGFLCERILGREYHEEALSHCYPLLKLLVFGTLRVHNDGNCDVHCGPILSDAQSDAMYVLAYEQI